MSVPEPAVALDDGLDLPRSQGGANPQHLLLGLFTDYWFAARDPLPSAALVEILAEFGYSAPAARAAIARLARRGVLDVTKTGRRTSYRMTPGAARALEQTQERLMTFGATDRPWDGLWTTVVFSLPEERRDLRYVLRRRLEFLGYAPLQDGVWLSPHADETQTTELLQSVDVQRATVLRSTVVFATGAGDPLRAWDLDSVRGRYEEFLDGFAALGDRAARGRVGAAEALVARSEVKDHWRELVSADPELPENLLPRGWPRRRAHRLFARTYDALGPLASARVGQLVAEHDPGLARQAGYRISGG